MLNVTKTLKPKIHLFALAFASAMALSSCIGGGGAGSDGAQSEGVALRVEPGTSVGFRMGSRFITPGTQFTTATFKIYREQTYKADEFSRTVLSGSTITHKYSKEESPAPLDYMTTTARTPTGQTITLSAFVGRTTPVNLDIGSTLVSGFFFTLLKRPPQSVEELENVERVILNGFNSGCFPSDAPFATINQAFRASNNSLLSDSGFQILVKSYFPTSNPAVGTWPTAMRNWLGENRVPQLASMSPLLRAGLTVNYSLSEPSTRVFSSQSIDPDSDLFSATWYVNDAPMTAPKVLMQGRAEIPKFFWYPSEMTWSTTYDDSTKAENAETILELRLCDGGAAQRHFMRLTIRDKNRAPKVITSLPTTSYPPISEHDVSNSVATTTIRKVEAFDEDGDRVFVKLDPTTSPNVLLSLSENPAFGIPIEGTWMKNEGSDYSSMTGAAGPQGWLPSQLASNKSPASISFNEATQKVTLKDFPTVGQNQVLDYERFMPIQQDLIGVRIRNVTVAHPVPISGLTLECTLRPYMAGQAFDFVCSHTHQARNEGDFEMRSSYGCPPAHLIADNPNPTCGFIPANIVNADGSSDVSKINAATKYNVYLVMRPSDQQAVEGKIYPSLIVSDTFDDTRWDATYPVKNVNFAPRFTKLLQGTEIYTMNPDVAASIKKPSYYYYGYTFDDPTKLAGASPLEMWELGSPIFQRTSGSLKKTWIENFEWRRLPQSGLPASVTSNNLFAENQMFFFESMPKDSLYARIRFGKNNGSSNNLVETVRKIKVYGESGTDSYFRVLNFFKTGATYNTDAICRAANFFTRNVSDFNNLPVNTGDFRTNPINSDVKILCVEAPASSCLREQDDLSCARALVALSDAEVDAKGVHFDLAVERLLYRSRASNPATDYYGKIQDVGYLQLQNSNFIEQAPIANGGYQGWNTWYSRVYYMSQTHFGYTDGGWADNVAPNDLSSSPEKIFRARYKYQNVSNPWSPQYNLNYYDVKIDLTKRTLRWDGYKPGYSYYATMPRNMGCRYLVRNKGTTISLHCVGSESSSISQSSIPKDYPGWVQITAPRNLLYGDPVAVVIDGIERAAYATAAATASTQVYVNASSTIIMKKGTNQNFAFDAPVYLDKSDWKVYSATGANRIFAGFAVNASNGGTQMSVTLSPPSTSRLYALEYKINPPGDQGEKSLHVFSESSTPLAVDTGSSSTTQLYDFSTLPSSVQRVGTTNIYEPVASISERMNISSGWSWDGQKYSYILFGEVADGDMTGAGTSDDLKFNIKVPEDLKINAYMVYKNKLGQLVEDVQVQQCMSWYENPLKGGKYRNFGLPDLKPGQYVFAFVPEMWCDSGFSRYNEVPFEITTADNSGASASLRFKVNIKFPPRPASIYAYGSGGMSGGEFNNNGCMPYWSTGDLPGGQDAIWEPKDLFVDQDGRAMPVTDLDGVKRYWTQYGTSEIFGQVNKTLKSRSLTQPAKGGMARGACTVDIYHDYGMPLSISFLKRSVDGTRGNWKFVDPTAENSPIPGFELGQYAVDPATTFVEAASDKEDIRTHSINSWTHTPRPRVLPNLLSSWKNSAGITDTVGSTATGLSSFRKVFFRTPYRVPGMNKYHVIFPYNTSINENNAVCADDVAHYASNVTTFEHLSSGTAPTVANINAECFEIKPNVSGEFERGDPEVDIGLDYHLKFKVYKLSNLIAAGTNTDMTCKALVNYEGMHSVARLAITCADAGNAHLFKFGSAISEFQELATSLYSDPTRTTFRIIPVVYDGNWDYGYHFDMTWGDPQTVPQGMSAFESPASLNAVLAVDYEDSGALTDPALAGYKFDYRTIAPVRLRVRDAKEQPDIDWSQSGVGLKTHLVEGEATNNASMRIRSLDPNVIPLVTMSPDPNPSIINNLGVNFLQPKTVEEDSTLQKFSADAAFLNYLNYANAETEWNADKNFKAVLQSRRNSYADVNNTYSETTYKITYTSPNYKDAHKTKFPWNLAVKGDVRLQMPLEFYAGPAADLAPDLRVDMNNTPATLERWIPRASVFTRENGTLIPIPGLITTQFMKDVPPGVGYITLTHHEYNKKPCVVGTNFIGQAKGTYCPDLDDRGNGSGANNSGYVGLSFARGPNGLLRGTATKSRDIKETSPGSGNFQIENTDLLEGQSFRIQFAVHDPNFVEGIRVGTPRVSEHPYTDPRFSYVTTIEAKTLTTDKAPTTGVSTQHPTGGVSAQTEHELKWTLQDIHVPKTHSIDDTDKALHQTPTPVARVTVKDVGEYPEPLGEDVEFEFLGWDVNQPPQYLGVVDSNLPANDNVSMRYAVDPKGTEPLNELIFAAYDPDRGDDLNISLENPETLGLTLGTDLIITPFKGETKIKNATCKDWVAAGTTTSIHPTQPVACLRVQFRVRQPSFVNLGFQLKIADKPWTQVLASSGEKAYDIDTRDYTQTIAQYVSKHPKPALLDAQSVYINYVGEVGGNGFLLPATPNPIAYLKEWYYQDFIFYSPEKREVSCELTHMPTLSSFVLDVQLPQSGQTLQPEEEMRTELIKTDPRFVICRLKWRPIVSFWVNTSGRTKVGVRFYENGSTRGSVTYKINREAFATADDFATQPYDGVRNTADYTYLDTSRPAVDSAAIFVDVPGKYTLATGQTAGSESKLWVFTYNKSSVQTHSDYPVTETWYIDGAPMSQGTESYSRIFGPTESGWHEVKLVLHDGGNNTYRTITRNIFVRNTALGIMSQRDQALLTPQGFNPYFETFDFKTMVSNYSGKQAVVQAVYNKESYQLISVNFEANTTSGWRTNILELINQQRLMTINTDASTGYPLIGLTDSGGPSKPNGSFVDAGFHSPFFATVSPEGLLSQVNLSGSEIFQNLYYNKYENVNGIAMQDQWVTQTGTVALTLTNDAVSTNRNARAIWFSDPASNQPKGYLSFGPTINGTPEQIFDFRVVKINTGANSVRTWLVVLAETGIYRKELVNSSSYVTWNGSWYEPPEAKSNDRIVTYTAPKFGGRLLVDETLRKSGSSSSLTIGAWTAAVGSNDLLELFNANSAFTTSNYRQLTDFGNSNVDPAGLAWPARPLVYLSQEAQIAHIALGEQSIISSFDLSTSPVEVRRYAIPGGATKAFQCHGTSSTCYVYDHRSNSLWRLK
jgi:hypothetical protein